MSRLLSAMKASPSQNLALTDNGAVTNRSSLSPVVDLFFVAGASRGQDLSSSFALAYNADQDLSIRLALWLRDVREGAGEREQFRNIFKWAIHNDRAAALTLLRKIPFLGRWDDVLVALNTNLHQPAVDMIKDALLIDKNGLCAKWMPRKGLQAATLRFGIGMSPKQYRKTLVELSKTVEQDMCARNWADINYSHVPSNAFSRYKKAFAKHAPDSFAQFVTKVETGKAKINAGAIFPHDIINALGKSSSNDTKLATELQWKALPDYLEGSDENILVMCDSSGSMIRGLPGSGVQPIDVAIALSIYMSERMGGYFKDSFLTFSSKPCLQTLYGSLSARVNQLRSASWDMTTDLHAAFQLILSTAKANQLSQSELPTKILIVSDMEFDRTGNHTNFDAARIAFAAAGYNAPGIVFWNVRGRAGNIPVTQHQSGSALVSGFSPAIVRSVLGQTELAPAEVMMKTLCSERYNH